jgi:hypothetical protein
MRSQLKKILEKGSRFNNIYINMLRILKIKLIITLLLIIFILLPVFVLAQTGTSMYGILHDAAGPAGAGYDTGAYLPRVAGSIARIFISILGVIFISYILYGGYLWMTAAGNEEKIEKAKTIIRQVIIGLIVVLAAAAIWYLIATVLVYGLSYGTADLGGG